MGQTAQLVIARNCSTFSKMESPHLQITGPFSSWRYGSENPECRKKTPICCPSYFVQLHQTPTPSFQRISISFSRRWWNKTTAGIWTTKGGKTNKHGVLMSQCLSSFKANDVTFNTSRLPVFFGGDIADTEQYVCFCRQRCQYTLEVNHHFQKWWFLLGDDQTLIISQSQLFATI